MRKYINSLTYIGASCCITTRSVHNLYYYVKLLVEFVKIWVITSDDDLMYVCPSNWNLQDSIKKKKKGYVEVFETKYAFIDN